MMTSIPIIRRVLATIKLPTFISKRLLMTSSLPKFTPLKDRAEYLAAATAAHAVKAEMEKMNDNHMALQADIMNIHELARKFSEMGFAEESEMTGALADDLQVKCDRIAVQAIELAHQYHTMLVPIEDARVRGLDISG
jgi:hypothetical protein